MIVRDVSGMVKIGQGAFATVYKAKYRKQGPEVGGVLYVWVCISVWV